MRQCGRCLLVLWLVCRGVCSVYGCCLMSRVFVFGSSLFLLSRFQGPAQAGTSHTHAWPSSACPPARVRTRKPALHTTACACPPLQRRLAVSAHVPTAPTTHAHPHPPLLRAPPHAVVAPLHPLRHPHLASLYHALAKNCASRNTPQSPS